MISIANTYKAFTPQCVSAFLALQNRVVNQATRSYHFEVLKAETTSKHY